MSELIGYLSEAEHLEGMLSGENQLEGELSIPEVVGGGLSEEVKQALLDLFQHMAYTDADGQDYYDALYNAFYPPAELTSISAVYTQSGSVFPDTPLDDLKDDLVVTAHYSDSTTEVVPSADYTLSGTLTAGTSVITVTYEDKTTTFNVTVSEPAVLSSITAVYTQSGTVYPTDSLDSLKPDLVVTAHYSDSSTATVTTYTLSGSLTVGTSTITVTYSGKTTTFNVTVTAVPVLDSITAVYTQSGTVYDTDSLDSLKADLVVTAVYTDSSTEVVPSTDYTLSGTLTVGTSTITVTYESKTTTFNVTVSEKYTYTLSELHLLNAGTTPGALISATPKPEGEIILLYTDMVTKRRSFTTPIVAPRCEKASTKAYPKPSDLTDTTEYPIKIPSDATGVSVSITPNTQYISIYAYSYDDTNHYVCDFVNGRSQTGWALGTGALSFPAGTYQYISLCSKYNSSGSSYPTDPTELTVTFTTT